MLKFAVFVSGGGTDLQSIIDAKNEGKINGEIALVLSNRQKAYGLQRAKDAGIETAVVKKDDALIVKMLKERNIDFILDDVTRIKFILRSCDTNNEYEEYVDISDIPYRQGKLTRINMDISFKNDNTMLVTVTDRGFGDFAKSSGKVIRKEICLDTQSNVSEGNV